MKALLPLTPALCGLLALVISPSVSAAEKPLKIMLITGGCCHAYADQKEILKKGIEERTNAVVDQIHVDDSGTKPPLPIYGNPDYAKGYDLVIHDECAADINQEEVVKAVLKPHLDGTPGVALHCAMHSYRIGDYRKKAQPGTPTALWFEFLGLQSSGHGKQAPIEIKFTEKDHPTTKFLKDWTTGNEELYNNVDVLKTATPLATGKQDKDDAVVVWTNSYGDKKTRVFGTTIGHNNATVEDPKYLDLVTFGLLWATDKLDADGKPKAGFGRPKK